MALALATQNPSIPTPPPPQPDPANLEPPVAAAQPDPANLEPAQPVSTGDAAQPDPANLEPPAQPSLGDRFMENVRAGFGGTLTGAAVNYFRDPATVEAERARTEAMPAWYDEPGALDKALAGGTALAGSVVGSLASPESWIPFGKGYQAVRKGAPLLREMAKDALIGAGVMGGANVGAQGINIAGGNQQDFDPAQAGAQAAMGATFGGAGPVVGKVVRGLRGPRTPELIMSQDRVNSVEAVRRAKAEGWVPEAPQPDPANLEPPVQPSAAEPVQPLPQAVPPPQETPPVPPPQETPPVPPPQETPPAPTPETSGLPRGNYTSDDPANIKDVEGPVAEKYLADKGIKIGDTVEYPRVYDPDGNPVAGDQETGRLESIDGRKAVIRGADRYARFAHVDDVRPVDEGSGRAAPGERTPAARPEQPPGVPGVGTEDVGRVQPQGVQGETRGEPGTIDRTGAAPVSPEGGPVVVRPPDAAEGRPAVSEPEVGRTTPSGEVAGAEPVAGTPAWRSQHPDIPTETYRGSGRAEQGSVYNGPAVPILGEGRYAAFDPEVAKTYGPNVEQAPLALKNPLVIRNDDQWRALTKQAGWEFPNPYGRPKEQVAAQTQALRDLVTREGHDGIVVHWNDKTPYDINDQGQSIKLLRNVFDTPQAVDYAATRVESGRLELGRELPPTAIEQPRPENLEPVSRDAGPVSQDTMPLEQDLQSTVREGTSPGAKPRSLPQGPLTDIQKAQYSARASPHRDVFRDAGHDPNEAANYPIKTQAAIVKEQTQKLFGYRRVGSAQTPIATRNMLADHYHNMKTAADATGMPYSWASLNGRLGLSLDRVSKKTLGGYDPNTRTIHLMGQSNSFAHELGHALDYYLAEDLAANPNARKPLSRDPKTLHDLASTNTPTSTSEAFAKLIGTMFAEDPHDALDTLRLQHEAGKGPKAGAAARAALQARETRFAQGGRGDRYYGDPAEMLARSHEAYLADRVENNGGDTHAISKPGEAYQAEGATALHPAFDKLYPKGEDQARIFAAWDEVYAAMRDDHLLGVSGDRTRLPPQAQDTINPRYWAKMANERAANGNLAAGQRKVISDWRHPLAAMKRNLGVDHSRPTNPKSMGTAIADAGREATFTPRALMDTLIERAPPGAKQAFQWIRDNFAGVEGADLREPGAGGRLIGQTYEEDVHYNQTRNINHLADAVQKATGLHDISRMSDTEADQWWRSMHGDQKGVPEHIKELAADTRALMDAEHARHNTDGGIDLAYASNYMGRVTDDPKIYNDPAGFQQQLVKVYEHAYDRDVDPNDRMKLIAVADQLRDELSPEVLKKVDQLRSNPFTPQAAQLHAEITPELRDAYARVSADHYANKKMLGGPLDYGTKGPAGSYLKGRVLPPEADQLLKDYYLTDPRTAVPMYFQQSARRIAYARRFGPASEKLEGALQGALNNGADPLDIRNMRRYAESLTGRMNSELPASLQRAFSTVQGLGTITLMARSAFSSLGEPMAAWLRTGDPKDAASIFASQIGDLFRTAGSKERKQLANAIALTQSALYDSASSLRMNAMYDNTPSMNKIVSRAMQMSGLHALTNAQERGSMVAMHNALTGWGEDLRVGNAVRQREAASQFRDLGIADKDHAVLADFLAQKNGRLPSMDDLDTRGGLLWGQAVRRGSRDIIQNPYKVDKPLLMSSSLMGRMMYGLMGFNYSFYHKVIERSFERMTARAGEAYERGKIAGGPGALGTASGAVRGGAVLARGGLNNLAAVTLGLTGASMVSTLVREAMFNPDKLAEENAKGNGLGYIADLGLQRTGISGPWDPVMQAINGLKYEKSVTGLFAGAQVGFFLHAMEKMVTGFTRTSPHTNTSTYNALEGFYQGVLMPAEMMALTALPGGPMARAGAGLASMYATSKAASGGFAAGIVGPKGSKEPPRDAAGNVIPGAEPIEEPPPEPGMEPEGAAADTGMSPLWGLADDLGVPVLKGLAPAARMIGRLPKAVKVGGGVLGAAGAAAEGIGSLADTYRDYRPPSGAASPPP
jgi:Large polyvalent protein-associated domain 1